MVLVDGIRSLLSSLYGTAIPYQVFIQLFLLNQDATFTRKHLSLTLYQRPQQHQTNPSSLGIHPKGFLLPLASRFYSHMTHFQFGSGDLRTIPSHLFGSFSLKTSLVVLYSSLPTSAVVGDTSCCDTACELYASFAFYNFRAKTLCFLIGCPLLSEHSSWWCKGSKAACGQGCPLAGRTSSVTFCKPVTHRGVGQCIQKGPSCVVR